MRSSGSLLSPIARRRLLGSVAARFVLALAFLFAQQTASLHWLSHAVDATQAKQKPAPADHCDQCLTLSAFGAAAASGSTELPLAAGQHALLAAPTREAATTPLLLAFRSRAPPIPS